MGRPRLERGGVKMNKQKNDGPRSHGRPRGKRRTTFFHHFILFRSN
jgi:hypothetical protein